LKDVDPRVFTRMLRKDGRKDGSITISLCNFVGEGIIKQELRQLKLKKILKEWNKVIQKGKNILPHIWQLFYSPNSKTISCPEPII
jgi:hypothetical protein